MACSTIAVCGGEMVTTLKAKGSVCKAICFSSYTASCAILLTLKKNQSHSINIQCHNPIQVPLYRHATVVNSN